MDELRTTDLFFPHERLECYRLALQVAQWIEDHDFGRGNADLRDQATRAARSVAFNIAEGCGRTGRARRYHFDVAGGSAAEAGSALDFVRDEGAKAQQHSLRRVALMVKKLR